MSETNKSHLTNHSNGLSLDDFEQHRKFLIDYAVKNGISFRVTKKLGVTISRVKVDC